MTKSRITRLRPVHCCAATLALTACSAAESPPGPGGEPSQPATRTPAVEAPAQMAPPATSESTPNDPTSPTSTTPEQSPAPVGLDAAPASGGESEAQAEPPPTAADSESDAQSEPPPTPPDPESEASTDATPGGECCPDGDCLCHGPAPTALTDRPGPFRTDSIRVDTGTLFHPTDAEPPFAGLAIAAGFLNTGSEILDWGEFFASHAIVTLVTTTNGADFPDVRAAKLARSIEELKALHSESGTPLSGKMSGRYGTSGYSMGGGGTTIATSNDQTLLSSVGLAPWAPVGRGITTPTLLMCGTTDGTAPCSMAEAAYAQIPGSTPKMLVVLPRVGHLAWLGGPTAANEGGAVALAFMKLHLEGDERWRSTLLSLDSDVTTNITE